MNSETAITGRHSPEEVAKLWALGDTIDLAAAMYTGVIDAAGVEYLRCAAQQTTLAGKCAANFQARGRGCLPGAVPEPIERE